MLDSGLLDGITHLVGMHVRPVDDMPVVKLPLICGIAQVV